MTRLVIGAIGRREFADCAATLSVVSSAREIQFAATLDEAWQMLADGGAEPDEFVLVQSWPGEFGLRDIERLRRCAPLAQIVMLIGSWCEGFARSSALGPPRASWHVWPARAEAGLVPGGDGEGHAPANLATTEDLLLAKAEKPLPRRAGRIALRVRQRVLAEGLADACRLVGYESVDAMGDSSHVIATIWDTTAEEAADAEVVAGARGLEGPMIALLDFPRRDQVEAALAAGVAAVVSKPLLLEELWGALDSVLGGRAIQNSPVSNSAVSNSASGV